MRAAYLLGRGSEELQVEHLPESSRVSLRFEPRADPATQLRVVEWALWRTGDHVAQATKLVGASRNTVSGLRAELRRGGRGVLLPGRVLGGKQDKAAAS